MTNQTIKVQGMSCGHCVSTIEKSLGKLDGVDKVDVSLSEGQVSVQFDSTLVSIDKIKETIDDQGFDVVE